jgi:outer membrane lipoprotein-sorting protein
MKSSGGRLIRVFAALALACCLGAEAAPAADFSAEVITKNDSQETRGKVFFHGDKMRQEGETINIARPDRRVMWLLVPSMKMAMEVPFSLADLGQAMALPKDKGQMKLLGTEKVNGYETEKFETTMKANGRTVKMFLWVAKKLDKPIKMVSEDGKFSMEYREIKEGGVSADLFEIPAGYQKMTMPQGMSPGLMRK